MFPEGSIIWLVYVNVKVCVALFSFENGCLSYCLCYRPECCVLTNLREACLRFFIQVLELISCQKPGILWLLFLTLILTLQNNNKSARNMNMNIMMLLRCITHVKSLHIP